MFRCLTMQLPYLVKSILDGLGLIVNDNHYSAATGTISYVETLLLLILVARKSSLIGTDNLPEEGLLSVHDPPLDIYMENILDIICNTWFLDRFTMVLAVFQRFAF
ncbi:hypothetical protein L1887_09073 [Cichorium endivia]|nr:hypothetical protein L1887_09073 [Cichorium endivia]